MCLSYLVAFTSPLALASKGGVWPRACKSIPDFNPRREAVSGSGVARHTSRLDSCQFWMRQCHPALPALPDPFASICLAQSTCSGPVSFYELEFPRPREMIGNANSYQLADVFTSNFTPLRGDAIRREAPSAHSSLSTRSISRLR